MIVLTNKNTEEFSKWKQSIFESGSAVLIDKEKDWTSFDVCAKLRGMVKTKKIGHAGTLDPLATGLLIVCIGKATKSIDSFQNMKKGYRTLIKLGATTKTNDAAQEEENIKEYSHISNLQIELALKNFIGVSYQKPPMYSARKINGQRLYELARRNIEVEVEPRKIEIYDIEIHSINLPFIDVSLSTSKGTYIRAIARDLGEILGTGAYLADLRRTFIGEYNADDALKLEDIQKLVNTENESLSQN
jgi:tRNA pseudouridine55 synthase